jgi:hypothetical protein
MVLTTSKESLQDVFRPFDALGKLNLDNMMSLPKPNIGHVTDLKNKILAHVTTL